MSKEEISDALEQSIRAVKMGDVERTPAWKKKWWDFCFWLESNNPFTKYIHVNSYEEYVKLPRSERTYLFFWYNRALFNSDGTIEGMFGKKEDRDAMDTYLKYRFPIQYYLREHLYYKVWRGYDKLCYFLNPRQKWLTKQIPNDWQDKVSLITDINFAMVIHFIEGEECFENTDYHASGNHHAKFADELRECYAYIKTERPELVKQHGDSYPHVYTGDYYVDYYHTNRLEKLIDDNDTKWLTWIVKNRKYFWT